MWLEEYPDIGYIYEANQLGQAELQPAQFYNKIQELPFIYGERQVHSELLPAIHRIAVAPSDNSLPQQG